MLVNPPALDTMFAISIVASPRYYRPSRSPYKRQGFKGPVKVFGEDPADGRGVALNVVAAREGSCEGKQGRMRLNSVPVVDQSGGEGVAQHAWGLAVLCVCVWARSRKNASFIVPTASDFSLENNEAASLIPEDLGVGLLEATHLHCSPTC